MYTYSAPVAGVVPVAGGVPGAGGVPSAGATLGAGGTVQLKEPYISYCDNDGGDDGGMPNAVYINILQKTWKRRQEDIILTQTKQALRRHFDVGYLVHRGPD